MSRDDRASRPPGLRSYRHWDNEWLIGPGMALDPAKYFIIVPNMLGNGLSSSPSNTSPPYDRARFPKITVYDQIVAQHRLVTEKFGIERLALVPSRTFSSASGRASSSTAAIQMTCLPCCGPGRTGILA
jgi:homoserine O-acetyltransferase